MPLRFDNVRKPRPRLLPRSPAYRMASMCLAVVLVGGFMARLQSREAEVLIAAIFGGEVEPAAKPQAAEGPGAEGGLESPVVDVQPLPPVDAEALAAISDNTYFRKAEAPAWFHLFGLLQEADGRDIAAASIGNVVHAQLAHQPTVYRGRIVSVVGEAVRIEPITPAANELGIETLYRITIRPAGGDLLPVLVYSLALPENFAPDKLPPHSAIFSGYFFKNQSYKNSVGVNIAPVILAKTFDAKLITPSTEPDRPAWPIWNVIAAALACATIVVVWILRRPAKASEHEPDGEVDFASLDYVPRDEESTASPSEAPSDVR